MVGGKIFANVEYLLLSSKHFQVQISVYIVTAVSTSMFSIFSFNTFAVCFAMLLLLLLTRSYLIWNICRIFVITQKIHNSAFSLGIQHNLLKFHIISHKAKAYNMINVWYLIFFSYVHCFVFTTFNSINNVSDAITWFKILLKLSFSCDGLSWSNKNKQ